MQFFILGGLHRLPQQAAHFLVVRGQVCQQKQTPRPLLAAQGVQERIEQGLCLLVALLPPQVLDLPEDRLLCHDWRRGQQGQQNHADRQTGQKQAAAIPGSELAHGLLSVN